LKLHNEINIEIDNKIDNFKTESNNIKINSNLIKTALLCYYRFKCGCKLACTEFNYGYGIADILTINKENEVIEVEIKISKSDLLSEGKHKQLKHLMLKESNNTKFLNSTPNRFYFCVPSDLQSEAIEYANDLNSNYGVMVFNYDPKQPQESIKIIKSSRLLHSKDTASKFNESIIKRITNDLCVCYRDSYWPTKVKF
jgi:hypothetical protein